MKTLIHKKKKTYANVAAGFLKKTKSRQATAAATAKPARPSRDDKAAWTAPVNQLAAGSGSLTPVAFCIYKKNKILFQIIFPPTTHYFSSQD